MDICYEHNEILAHTQPTIPTIPMPADRREALRLWLIANKISLVELGKLLGMTGPGVSMLVRKERMQTGYHKALVDYGIPAAFLPRPEDRRTGPKPKQAQPEAGAA